MDERRDDGRWNGPPGPPGLWMPPPPGNGSRSASPPEHGSRSSSPPDNGSSAGSPPAVVRTKQPSPGDVLSMPSPPANGQGTEHRSPDALLDVRGVSVRFGGIQALDQVSMTVASGESVGLVGPNGAGKTTLFDCISGRIRPNTGSITFAGVQLDGVTPHRRARLGLARTFQRLEVFPELTVREHLIVADRARRGSGALWRDLLNMAALRPDEAARVASVIELVGLEELADVPVAALGLGRCRLVELARALACEPTLLLADEPSSGLDRREADALADVIRTVQQRRSMAVLLVEHDLEMVARATDRVVVLDVGAVIAEGRFDEVVALTAVRRAYLGAGT